MYSTAKPSVLLVVSDPAMNRSRHSATNCSSAHQSVYKMRVHKHTLVQQNVKLLPPVLPIYKLPLDKSKDVKSRTRGHHTQEIREVKSIKNI
jgi:hypothetical protein